MDALDRLRLNIFMDEIREHCQQLNRRAANILPVQRRKIGICLGEADEDVEGRVWVEVGKKGFRLRVIHLHPANPSVASLLKRKKSMKSPATSEELYINGPVQKHPENDEISSSSLEDYWFNHWQGPHITADNNQNSYNLSKLSQSHRKSLRKRRCSICHKKLIGVELAKEDNQCYDEAKNVLAHVPSIIPETCVKEENEDKSDDEISKVSTSDDNVSKYSMNDEQIARVSRILDNEIRMGYTLFSGENVSQDVVDTAVVESSAVDSGMKLLSPQTLGSKLRQCKSAPCSPKLQARTSSPKSTSSKMSKFSLSSSLLAIHKQTSSFKYDLEKSESTPCTSSYKSSIKSHRCNPEYQYEYDNIGGDFINEKFLNPTIEEMDYVESPRIPKVNLIINSDVEIGTKNNQESKMIASMKEGVVNLGFDGLGETSDFDLEDKYSHSQKLEVDLSKTHAVSIGHLSKGVNYALSVEPSTGLIKEGKGDIKDNEFIDIPLNDIEPSKDLYLEDLNNDYNDDFQPKDVMEQAREMVYWWHSKQSFAHSISEFCIHEDECKVKQKPLLMFLHGIGSSADSWNSQLWYFLSCGYEVVAPDLLGHGLSSAPKSSKYYLFSRMLDYVGLVFDLFVPHGRKCIIIGHNYGCSLAVALARGRPMSVCLAVLAACGAPNPLVPVSDSEKHAKFNTLIDSLISCGCLSREMLYKPRGKHFSALKSCSTPKYVLENIIQGQNWPEGDLAFHRRITIPTLLLYGLRDNVVSLVDMCEMEKTIPRAFLQLIPSAGHELSTDAVEEVSRAIHKFIKRWKNLT